MKDVKSKEQAQTKQKKKTKNKQKNKQNSVDILASKIQEASVTEPVQQKGMCNMQQFNY